MDKFKIENNDVLKWCKEYSGPKFMALLSDPPYHLTSITERFGKQDSAPAQFGTDGVFGRVSRGFLGELWDGGNISFESETWRALGRHLYPGAFGMAFASSRGYHRLAVAIEDAGFIIHPAISWINSQGFPKATRIDTAIDRDAGKVRVGKIKGGHIGMSGVGGDPRNENARGDINSVPHVIGRGKLTKNDPVTQLAKEWEGHRYGAQALKPSAEFICVFQKPYEGRPIDNITHTGAGALNIERGRIGYESDGNLASNPSLRSSINGGNGGHIFPAEENRRIVIPSPQGRWPGNIILQHSPFCRLVGYKDGESYTINRFSDGMKPFGNGAGHEFDSENVSGGQEEVWECVDGCAILAMNLQSGVLKSGKPSGKTNNDARQVYGKYTGDVDVTGYGDEGFASRFFYHTSWNLENSDPFFYASKASTAEREAGLDDLPLHEVRTHGDMEPDEDGDSHNTTGQGPAIRHNIHSTVKPISLTSYLAGLLLPPPSYAPRRILIPFSGVSSEMIGAMLAGWDEITGIEMMPEYAEIGNKRMEFWERYRNSGKDIKEIAQGAKSRKKTNGQISMWEENNDTED